VKQEWGISAPWPTAPLNMNDRNHTVGQRRESYARKAAWRDLAYWLAKQARPLPQIVGRSEVTLTMFVRDPGRRRDPSNWYPTLKALVDGLTKAGVWPDDDSTHVLTAEPRFVRGADQHFTLTVTWEVDE
jgi:Holliday junction resolvase RusA-like endonuclease